MYEMTQTHSTPMPDDLIRRNAPSVFAAEPYHEVSDRYAFVPTINIIDALRGQGWMPVDASQNRVRLRDRQEFTKHLVRFRRLGDDIQIGDSVMELLLTNSHDRASAFSLHAGVFRMACANGIVIADSTLAKIKVRHSGDAAREIIEGSYHVIDEVPKIAAEVEEMQSIDLTQPERRIFADAAYKLIAPDLKEGQRMITQQDSILSQMLTPRRREDNNTDLWTTYNVLQEKVIRGGVRTTKVSNGKVRRSTTRKVRSIDRDIKLNKALWEMAVQMKELKNAA